MKAIIPKRVIAFYMESTMSPRVPECQNKIKYKDKRESESKQ